MSKKIYRFISIFWVVILIFFVGGGVSSYAYDTACPDATFRFSNPKMITGQLTSVTFLEGGYYVDQVKFPGYFEGKGLFTFQVDSVNSYGWVGGVPSEIVIMVDSYLQFPVHLIMGNSYVVFIYEINGQYIGDSMSITDMKILEVIDNNFPDVGYNKFAPFVYKLKLAGIIKGYSDGTYRLNNNVTRGEFSVFLVNSLNIPIDTSGDRFPDVDESSNFFPYIQTLKNKEIVNGFSDGYYHSERSITRGEIAKMVDVGLTKADKPITPSASNTYFTDVPIDNVFYENIYRLAGAKIMIGYSDGTFRPSNFVTRAELSKVIWSCMNYPYVECGID